MVVDPNAMFSRHMSCHDDYYDDDQDDCDYDDEDYDDDDDVKGFDVTLRWDGAKKG